MAPEVEESVLQLADDFVDGVITSACKVAKLRGSGSGSGGGGAGGNCLEVRDLQLVLERNWGIRVPGFALEEVRSVRRFQPTVEWQRKMQAVQSSKTLGGVGGGKGDA